MSDLVKRLREWWEYDTGHLVSESIARIEQLERELARMVDLNEKNKEVAGRLVLEKFDLLEQLAAEKVLADRLAAQLQGWWDCADTFPWRDGEDRAALDAYRKARGL